MKGVTKDKGNQTLSGRGSLSENLKVQIPCAVYVWYLPLKIIKTFADSRRFYKLFANPIEKLGEN
tara:strand:- start:1249 stop:1443 length:195 start_codon:yes stop_codon:yes gene_type:complete